MASYSCCFHAIMVSFVGKWNESYSEKNSEIVGKWAYKGLLRGLLIDSKGCLASKYFMIRNFLTF